MGFIPLLSSLSPSSSSSSPLMATQVPPHHLSCILYLFAILFSLIFFGFFNCRAFLYKGFLSHQECDHLISLVSEIPSEFVNLVEDPFDRGVCWRVSAGKTQAGEIDGGGQWIWEECDERGEDELWHVPHQTSGNDAHSLILIVCCHYIDMGFHPFFWYITNYDNE